MRIYAVFVLLGAGATATRDPMVKVLGELEKLKTNIGSEMEAESKNYEDFACYCQDTEEEKSTHIENLNDDKNAQKATMQEAEDNQSSLRDDIAANEAEIARLTKNIATANQNEADAVEAHNASAEELESAIKASKDAISSLQKGIGITSLLQSPMIKQAIALGQAMGFKSASFISMPSVDQADDGGNSATTASGVTQQLRDDSASRKVIGMLQDLLKQFRDELKSQTNERLAAQAVYNNNVQELSQANVNEKAALERNQNELAATTELLQNTQKSFTQTTRMLDQDAVYLNDLTNECTLAKADYDQRSKFSLEELRMLSMVHTILEEKAKAHFDDSRDGDFKHDTEGKEMVLSDCNAVHQEWRDEQDNKEAAELPGWTDKLRPKTKFVQVSKAPQASLLETFAAAPAFLQRRMETVRPHNEVADVLRASADKIGSPTLAALATKVDAMAPGVFDRVNALIRQLIQRLQKEQSADIAHHGYCASQMSEMKQARDTAKANMDAAGAAAGRAYGRSETLRAGINDLQQENAETQRAWMEAQRIWQCQHEQNTQMLHEVSKGQEAMTEAIDTVKNFFETTAVEHGSGSAGAQQKSGDDEDSSKRYDRKGNQGGRKQNWDNIMTLMETMRDELIKNEADTKQAEADATKSYKQFESDSKADMGAKHATRKQKIAERSESNQNMQSENEKHSEELQALNSALEMWESLRKSCQSEGVKPEERAAKRQAEVAALKEALGVLNQVTAH